MALVGDIIACFVIAATAYVLLYALGDVEQYQAILFAAVIIGSCLGGIRSKQGGDMNAYDRFGVFAGILYFIGMFWWWFSDIGEITGPEGIDAGFLIFILLVFCCIPAFAIYGLFAFLGMVLPAPSGRRRRPGPVERPYSYPERGRSGYGDDVDPGVYGGRRDPPPPQEPPHIHIHMPPPGASNGQAGGAQRPEPAPPDAARVEYQPAQGYSTEYAQRLFRESRVRGAPSNSKAASQLAGHCLAALGPHAGMAFLNAAARDDKLPKKTRQFYAQALMEMERRTAGN